MFELIKTLAKEQTNPLYGIAIKYIADKLGFSVERIEQFVEAVRVWGPPVINSIIEFIGWTPVFAAAGDGLTDAAGCNAPDCPHECQGFEDVLVALQAEDTARRMAA